MFLHKFYIFTSLLKITSVNILYFVTLKSMVYLALGINPLPMHDFVTASIGHLKNIGSLDYVDFPSIDTSLYIH